MLSCFLSSSILIKCRHGFPLYLPLVITPRRCAQQPIRPFPPMCPLIGFKQSSEVRNTPHLPHPSLWSAVGSTRPPLTSTHDLPIPNVYPWRQSVTNLCWPLFFLIKYHLSFSPSNQGKYGALSIWETYTSKCLNVSCWLKQVGGHIDSCNTSFSFHMSTQEHLTLMPTPLFLKIFLPLACPTLRNSGFTIFSVAALHQLTW